MISYNIGLREKFWYYKNMNSFNYFKVMRIFLSLNGIISINNIKIDSNG